MLIQGQAGPQVIGDGAYPALRLGKTGDAMVSELHGKYYEQCYRGNMYSYGISNTALVAANAIATGVAATAQPVIGLYNPITSPVNLVILQAQVIVNTVANTAVSPGGFMFLGSAGNTAVSTGSVPVNSKTLIASGSSAKVFAISTALTGLTNSLAVLRPAQFAVLNAAGAATAASIIQSGTTDFVEGSIIVPPGGVVAIMNQVSTTTVSVSAGIFWEEVPV